MQQGLRGEEVGVEEGRAAGRPQAPVVGKGVGAGTGGKRTSRERRGLGTCTGQQAGTGQERGSGGKEEGTSDREPLLEGDRGQMQRCVLSALRGRR